MKHLSQEIFTGERALYMQKDLLIEDSVFRDGESPLKESENIRLSGCLFKWKYPLWYGKNFTLTNCTLFDMARAGIWYTQNISLNDCLIEAPKTFRRSSGITLENVRFFNAAETLWNCRGVKAKNVSVKGDYFAMNAEDFEADGLELDGNYSFDGAKRVVIRRGKLLSKDAFWNAEDVVIYDSFISGEYFGWNSKNITLVNCTVESLQGFCYIENLVMTNCKLIDTTLSFEYSTVDAEISGRIESVKNPRAGRIIADEIGELILEEDKIDKTLTRIMTKKQSADDGEI